MIGTLINVAAIIAGSLIGLMLRRGMKKEISDTIMRGLGLCTVLIGLTSALKTENMLLVIMSMTIGGALGALIDIKLRLDKLGDFAQRKLTRAEDGDDRFSHAFVSASLLFCVGAMAVVGSLDSGIRGDHSTLIAKSVLDGVASIVFAGTLGIGVMLSAVPVFIYQGAIALTGSAIAPLLSESVIREMSAVGGLLIAGIGINMLLDRDIPVANLLPAIFVPFAYYPIAGLF